MALYVRDLEDGTEQIVDFPEKPGEAGGWRLVETKETPKRGRKKKDAEK